MQAERQISEPARLTPVLGHWDVVVVGGGPAGMAAAVSAARHGARTLLVERYGFLGGMGTAAGVTNFCGLHANVFGTIEQVVHGVADDLLARMRALGLFGHSIPSEYGGAGLGTEQLARVNIEVSQAATTFRARFGGNAALFVDAIQLLLLLMILMPGGDIVPILER